MSLSSQDLCKSVEECILYRGGGSCNRPGVAQRVPGSLGSQISMKFGT